MFPPSDSTSEHITPSFLGNICYLLVSTLLHTDKSLLLVTQYVIVYSISSVKLYSRHSVFITLSTRVIVYREYLVAQFTLCSNDKCFIFPVDYCPKCFISQILPCQPLPFTHYTCYCLEGKSVMARLPLRYISCLLARAVRQGGWLFYCQGNLPIAM